MKRITTAAALCGSLLGVALALPAQAQNYPYTPGTGPDSGSTQVGTVIIVERPGVTTLGAEPESASSRDAQGLPTRGAPGTGNEDRDVAIVREGRYWTPVRRPGR
jgi:hypothetical protein